MRCLSIAFALSLLGCGGGCGSSDAPRETPTAPGRPEPTTGETSGTTEQPEPEVIKARLRAARDHDRFAPILENRSEGRVHIARDLHVERETGGQFSALAGSSDFTFRSTCGDTPAECIELVTGAALEPLPWNGKLGSAQCGCESCPFAPTGRYRFVATTCEGSRIEGDAFDWVSP